MIQHIWFDPNYILYISLTKSSINIHQIPLLGMKFVRSQLMLRNVKDILLLIRKIVFTVIFQQEQQKSVWKAQILKQFRRVSQITKERLSRIIFSYEKNNKIKLEIKSVSRGPPLGPGPYVECVCALRSTGMKRR